VSDGAWAGWLNSYGVWWGGEDATTRAFTEMLEFPVAGNYTFKLLADNSGSITLDGNKILEYAGFQGAPAQMSGQVGAGFHTVTVSVRNDGGPAGVGVQILKPDGTELWNSRQVVGYNPDGTSFGTVGQAKGGDGGGAGGGGGGFAGGYGGLVQGGDNGGYSGSTGKSAYFISGSGSITGYGSGSSNTAYGAGGNNAIRNNRSSGVGANGRVLLTYNLPTSVTPNTSYDGGTGLYSRIEIAGTLVLNAPPGTGGKQPTTSGSGVVGTGFDDPTWAAGYHASAGTRSGPANQNPGVTVAGGHGGGDIISGGGGAGAAASTKAVAVGSVVYVAGSNGFDGTVAITW
jgi:hypothetical protein